MTRPAIGLVTLVLLGRAGPVGANEYIQKPEQLIPATAQAYFCWDGVAAHRQQYAQTAMGQLLGRDLAPLRQQLLELYPRLLRSELTQKKLLDGMPPARLAKIHAAVAQSSKLLDVIADHGLIVSAEIAPPNLIAMAFSAAGKKSDNTALLPRVQVMLIIPGAAADAGAVLSTLRLFDADKSFEVKEETVDRRKLLHITQDVVHIAAWVEGKHVVINIGTEPPAAVTARMDSQQPRLDTNPLYRRLVSEEAFRTDLRAFVDVKAVMTLAQGVAAFVDPSINKNLEAVGIAGVNSILYRSGFDGPAVRDRVEIDAPGPRQGLLRLVGGKPLTLDQLPPLPADVSRWSAHRLDPAAVYEVATKLFDVAHPPEPGAGPAETAAERLNKAAGIDLKADLLPYLGDVLVAYSSPSEGLISFGQVLAMEVKDGDNVLQALDQIVQTQAGGTVRIRKRPVADGEVREVYVKKQGFFFTPTYAVHKNWLVVSLFPQAVQAFVQRAGGGAKAWEPDANVLASLQALPRNAVALAVADHRPSVQQGLTFAPLFIAAIQGFGNNGGFEVGSLPGAGIVNQRLTPSVTALTDDGRTLRWQSRGAVLLPGDFLGVDPVLLLLSAQILN